MTDKIKSVNDLRKAYVSGELSNLEKRIDKLSLPRSITDRRALKDFWSELDGISSKVEAYSDVVPLAQREKDFDPALSESIRNILFLRSQVNDYRQAIKGNISSVIDYSREVLAKSTINTASLNRLTKQKVRLQDALNASIVIDYVTGNDQAQEILAQYNERLHLIRTGFDKERNASTNAHIGRLLKDASHVLFTGSRSEQKKMYHRLQDLPMDDDSIMRVHRKKVQRLLGKYNSLFDSQKVRSVKKTRSFFKRLFLGGLAAGLLYTGWDFIGVYHDKVSEVATSYAVDKVESDLQEKKSLLATYSQQIKSNIDKRASLENKIKILEEDYHKKQDLSEERLKLLEDEFLRKRSEYQQRLNSFNQKVRKMEAPSSSPYEYQGVKFSFSRSLDMNIRSDPSWKKNLSRLAPLLSSYHRVLYIDKSSNRTFVFSGDKDDVVVEAYFRHTDAVDPLPKNAAGQKRTPEGLYKIVTNHLRAPSDYSGGTIFGSGFIRISYPTADQMFAGYSGGGVLLVGAPDDRTVKAIKAGRDVMNVGVAYINDDFKIIHRLVGEDLEKTIVVIENSQERPLRNL